MEGSLVAYKVFTNGSVLQASELNENLMQQSTAVFSNAAARTAAITSPVEGQLTYLEDVDLYESYNGSSWGSPFGLTLISSTAFSGVTSVNFNNVFSSTYRNYKVIIEDVVNATTTAALNFRMRNAGADRTDSTYSYSNQLTNLGSGALTNTSAASQAQGFFGGSRTAAAVVRLSVDFFSPFVATSITDVVANGVAHVAAASNMTNSANRYGTLNSNDGFSLISASGNIEGRVTVYGYRN
jgi:hypothetical protein